MWIDLDVLNVYIGKGHLVVPPSGARWQLLKNGFNLISRQHFDRSTSNSVCGLTLMFETSLSKMVVPTSVARWQLLKTFSGQSLNTLTD